MLAGLAVVIAGVVGTAAGAPTTGAHAQSISGAAGMALPRPAAPKGGAVALGEQGTVTRDGRAMTWHLSYRLPAPTGTTPAMPGAFPAKVRLRWVAYGGSRESRTLRRIAHGQGQLVPRDGVVTFRRRVAVPTAGAMRGGFCAEFDLTALGVAEPAVTCPTGPTATRRQLPARVPEVTVIADSVGAGLDYITGGRAKATGPWSAVFDLKVCRRLVAPPCPPNPPSTLSVIRSLPTPGDIVLIHVGHNDAGATYDIGRVMATLKARGVKRAVWLTLQSIAPSASGVNAAVRTAATRYDWLQVADWSAHSAGRSWFVGDRDHLTPSGAEALAAFYRAEIAKAIRALEPQPDSPAR
ncbi:MAG: hypothetical protein FJW92_00025 [Actinobacteria bacterium]|nr:hypothetical protein [Actinomycetota bacterium]